MYISTGCYPASYISSTQLFMGRSERRERRRGWGWPDPPSSYGPPNLGAKGGKFFFRLNPLAPKERKKTLPQTVEGDEGGRGGGVQGGGNPRPTVDGRSNASLPPPPWGKWHDLKGADEGRPRILPEDRAVLIPRPGLFPARAPLVHRALERPTVGDHPEEVRVLEVQRLVGVGGAVPEAEPAGAVLGRVHALIVEDHALATRRGVHRAGQTCH